MSKNDLAIDYYRACYEALALTGEWGQYRRPKGVYFDRVDEFHVAMGGVGISDWGEQELERARKLRASGMIHREIAQVLGRSEQSVKNKLCRVRKSVAYRKEKKCSTE